ncbi:hypothetical protein EDB81DRAFT_762066 [Dactylonectria macrodidyma]|uniref:NACHT domain-containing protein n=1 Tax=Dactylonectria macrodidyma TaxID=307937 RepID=A0A9P9EDL7_9HYPO|nr:hypothetical protein EDB81DRAFT_762066 [Dactylonectria macrodidyma]
MEALGLVSSVIAVIQMTDLVIDICKHYIGAVKGAPGDLSLILIEASALKGLLDPLKTLLQSPRSCPSSDSLTAPVEECRRVISELGVLIGCDGKSNGQGGRKKKTKKMTLCLDSLAWPLKQSKAMKLLNELATHKATISLSLQTSMAVSVRGVVKDVGELKDSVSGKAFTIAGVYIVLTLVGNIAAERDKRLSSTRNTPLTGFRPLSSGLTGSLEAPRQLLWVYGIPGAGKTVLASSVIERLKSRCSHPGTGERHGYAYYYCYHARTNQNDVESFLGWMTSQLCRQADFLPPEIKETYSLGTRPSVAEYLRPLKLVCQRFDKLFIVIDALDESQSRHKFIDFLRLLTQDQTFSNMSILVTSRDEIDIRRALHPVSISLSMSNCYVDQDIRHYIQSELCSDPKFTRWPLDLRESVEDALSQGAKGMFRWAACQLEILRRLNQPSAIRAALIRLPETLDETYERILCSIPEESKKSAYRALELLCAKGIEPIATAENLLEAVFWGDVESKYPEDQLFGVDSLQEICVCLVTVSQGTEDINTPMGSDTYTYTGRRIELAHYTVKEFLFSKRIQLVPARYFQTTADKAFLSYLDTTLRSIIRSNDSEAPTKSVWFDFCWEILPSMLFDYDIANKNDSHTEMIYTLLDPANGFLSQGARGPLFAFASLQPLVPLSCWGNPDDEGPAVVIALFLIMGLRSLAEKYMSKFGPEEISEIMSSRISFDIFQDCTLLDVALTCVSLFAMDGVRFLFRNGFSLQPSSRTLFFLSRLNDDMRLRCASDFMFPRGTSSQGLDPQKSDLMWYLLEAGADPNPRNVPATPLQLAVLNKSWEAVRLLLKAGADPNRVGDANFLLPTNHLPIALYQDTPPFHLYLEIRRQLKPIMREEFDALFATCGAKCQLT